MEKGLFLVLRLRNGVLKSGMAGRYVGGRQNSTGRRNWKREYIYIYCLSFFFSRKSRCLFCLYCTMLQVFYFLKKKTLNNLSYNSKQLNKLILFELY